MAIDPLASLRPVAVIVPIGGRDFTLAAKPAQDWLEVLLDDEPKLHHVIPGWCEPGCEQWIYRSLLLRTFSVKEWGEAVVQAIGVASGRSWWQALNLINGMKDPSNWHQIFGHLTLRGLDVQRVSLGAWLDATYALCVEGMDPDEKIKFNLALDTPPVGANPEDVIDPAEQERAFMSLMAEVTGGR